jgi:adenylate cyclase
LQEGERRLAAIMFTDLVGFTALGQRNERLALSLLEEHRRMLRPIFKEYAGKEVKTMGDAFLVDFPSALNAVRCAYEIQKTARDANRSRPDWEGVHLRIGIHIGDVLESAGDISGDAVNVASRIVSLADDGGVCVTRQVRDLVQNKFEQPLTSLGTRSLKNVSSPIEVFKVEFSKATESSSGKLDPSRIAVLPFANMSPDPNDSYFADGITEEIISTLSSVGGLNVISRTSVMGYKGTVKKVKEIGNELEAGSVLEGSFRKAGNKIRVTTQLISVNNDLHVWAQSYDRNLDDVFTVQTDIARHVADALRVKILAPEIDRIDKKPTYSTKAYSLYLRGRFHWNKRGIEDFKKAMDYFEQAVNEDPQFALGYVGLADVYELLATNWGIEPETNHEKARATVTKALELDEGLAEGHATRGLILTHDYLLDAAEEEFQKAIALKPSYSSGHQWYYHVLLAETRWDEAFKQIEKAVELDPFSIAINLNHAQYYLARRDYQKALELTKKVLELDPNIPLLHFQLAEAYAKLRQLDNANRESRIAAGLVRDSYPIVEKMHESFVAYYEGDEKKITELLPELENHLGETMGPGAIDIASLCFKLGNKNKGFEWLEKACERREYALMNIVVNDSYDGIRDDPRYYNILERIGLARFGQLNKGSSPS